MKNRLTIALLLSSFVIRRNAAGKAGRNVEAKAASIGAGGYWERIARAVRPSESHP